MAAVAALAAAALVTALLVAGSGSATFDFQTAFNNAAPGSTVTVPDGSYPAQTITGTAKSLPVTFAAQTPGQVKVASLSVNVDRVHFQGVVADGAGETRGSLTVCGTQSLCPTRFTDVVFDGFAAKSAFIRASGVTVIRSEFGGANGCANVGIEDAFRFWGGSGVNATPTNDTIQDSTIHDWTGGTNGTCDGTVTPTPHLDCMQNDGGQNITVRNVTFTGCPSSNIQWQPFGAATIGSSTVTSSYLGPTACCNRIVFGVPTGASTAPCPTLHVTGNTIAGTSVNTGGCPAGSEDISGNTFCGTACTPPAPVPPPAVCSPTCDEQIAALTAQNAALEAKIAQALTDLTGSG
jgi:hypothetical protein